MKLFIIQSSSCDYDQYDQVIVAALSPLDAIKASLSKGVKITPQKENKFEYDDSDKLSLTGGFFKVHQSPLTVREVKLAELEKPTVLFGSFNAG